MFATTIAVFAIPRQNSSNMPGTPKNISATGCLVLILPLAFSLTFVFFAWPVLLALGVLILSFMFWQKQQWQKLSQKINPFFHQLIKDNLGSVTALDLAMKTSLSAETAKRYLDAKVQEFGARTVDYEDQGTVYYFITASTLGSIFDDSEPPSLYDRTPLTPTTQPSSREESQPTDPSVTAKTYDDSVPFSRHHSEPIKPSTLGKIFDDSEPPTIEESAAFTPEVPQPIAKEQPATTSLTQEQEKQSIAPLKGKTVTLAVIQSELARRLDVHSSTVLKRRSDPDFSEWTRSRDPEGISWKYAPDTKLFYPLDTTREHLTDLWT